MVRTAAFQGVKIALVGTGRLESSRKPTSVYISAIMNTLHEQAERLCAQSSSEIQADHFDTAEALLVRALGDMDPGMAEAMPIWPGCWTAGATSTKPCGITVTIKRSPRRLRHDSSEFWRFNGG